MFSFSILTEEESSKVKTITNDNGVEDSSPLKSESEWKRKNVSIIEFYADAGFLFG